MGTEAARVVKRRLKELGWSQGRLRREMLARGEKVPTGLVSRWLDSTREPNMTRAALMQELLGVEPRLWAVPAKGRAA